ncbi:hypothetical protein SEA_KUDEFRE_4 [Gordonia phage Kudefre]|uniref:Uncharacterized protein n=1 Tax=Gordonia phage Kudefre TaxID=2885975 RepID=A0AAE8Y6A1_9CAUD|nr:hypothetical protein L3Y24_gp004 [Gordonia phage Kudefre]UDL15239.1 hypothetical protein SEA_KUDEFRE_4 [Gordonia phage Kudefre]
MTDEVRVAEAPYCDYCNREAFYRVKLSQADDSWANLCGLHYRTIKNAQWRPFKRIIVLNEDGTDKIRMDPDYDL